MEFKYICISEVCLFYSSGVMYSMHNIEIQNTLSIKQIFELFPCSCQGDKKK